MQLSECSPHSLRQSTEFIYSNFSSAPPPSSMASNYGIFNVIDEEDAALANPQNRGHYDFVGDGRLDRYGKPIVGV